VVKDAYYVGNIKDTNDLVALVELHDSNNVIYIEIETLS
jgi:transcription elongation factor